MQHAPFLAVNEQISANQRRSSLLVVAFAAAVAVLVGGVLAVAGLGPWGLLAGVVAGAAAATAVRDAGEGMALRAVQARPVGEAEAPRLHNLVEGLCGLAGLPKPALYVVEEEAPNAFAVGREPRRAALVVTRGLLGRLDRVQLEAVVAHELAHIRSHDVAVATTAIPLLAVPARVLPALGSLLERVLGPHREVLADAYGVALTRYPPALVSALEVLREQPLPAARSPRSVTHLWLAPPAGDTLRPPLDERIAVLREL